MNRAFPNLLTLVLLALATSSTTPAQERPADGEGSVFVDDYGFVGLNFVDLRGNLLSASFSGSPGDFVRLAPDGRYFLKATDAEARVKVRSGAGDWFTGTARFEEAVYVRCPVFDPVASDFQCFFPGPGNAELNARGTVTDSRGRVYDLRAHLTGIFLTNGPLFRNIINTIDLKPTKRRKDSPPVIVPTHLGSVPVGTLVALEESTAQATGLGSIGFTSFSGLAMADDGRLYGTLGREGLGRLLEIDSATATVMRVLETGWAAIPGLDFGPAGTPFSGRLYGAAYADGSSTSYLITIDPATGQTTNVGVISNLPFVDAIVFRRDGSLYGAGFINGVAAIARIDPLTGSATPLGSPTGFAAIAGLEEASDGALIASLATFDPQAGSLIRVDPATGIGTLIGPTGFVPVSGLARLPDLTDLAGF